MRTSAYGALAWLPYDGFAGFPLDELAVEHQAAVEVVEDGQELLRHRTPSGSSGAHMTDVRWRRRAHRR